MLGRIAAIALNTYREAVRARILFGLLGAALATTSYSLVVATLSLHQESRVVSDVGAASISPSAGPAPDDRGPVIASGLLTLSEVAIVTAIATVFASFSSPFLTAMFTLGVFFAGRSADTMARLPVHVFGPLVHDVGALLARIFP